MKKKSYLITVVKQWYSDIAELRQKHTLVVVMCDNAGEANEFFESVGDWESRITTAPLASNGRTALLK